jgi:hypothetical protein
MSIFADNEVVMHGDAERIRDCDDLLGHFDIGVRRRRIAGRMIVQDSV